MTYVMYYVLNLCTRMVYTYGGRELSKPLVSNEPGLFIVLWRRAQPLLMHACTQELMPEPLQSVLSRACGNPASYT